MSNKTAIVIRTFSGRDRFFKRICDSIFNQTFSNKIVCVLNVGDDSFSYDEVFDADRAIYYTSDASELFNYLDKEEVKYISILDDDDSLSPEFYSRLISVLVNKKICRSAKAITTHVNKVFEYVENNRIRISRTEPLNHHLKNGLLPLDTLRYRDVLEISSFIFDYNSFKDLVFMHDLKDPAFFWPFIIHFGLNFYIFILEEAMVFKHIREVSSYSEDNFTHREQSKYNNYLRIKFHELYRIQNVGLNNFMCNLLFS